jgi:hypothetical protein
MAFTQADKDQAVKIQTKVDALINEINESLPLKSVGGTHVLNELRALKPTVDALAAKEVDPAV